METNEKKELAVRQTYIYACVSMCVCARYSSESIQQLHKKHPTTSSSFYLFFCVLLFLLIPRSSFAIVVFLMNGRSARKKNTELASQTQMQNKK